MGGCGAGRPAGVAPGAETADGERWGTQLLVGRGCNCLPIDVVSWRVCASHKGLCELGGARLPCLHVWWCETRTVTIRIPLNPLGGTCCPPGGQLLLTVVLMKMKMKTLQRKQTTYSYSVVLGRKSQL